MDGTIRLLAFAGARDVVGAPEVSLVVPEGADAATVLAIACIQYPGLVPYRKALRVAVNGTYAAAGDPVRAGDEVALIPPVAGG